jgi:uncharacterized protein (DUF362 family)
MAVSIIHRADATYPAPDEHYSPGERYPEYKYDQVATQPNLVYEMVRESFSQMGLDKDRFGTAAWNPLGDLISPGSRVFLLCNFVFHRRQQESSRELWAKCTHGSVLRALIDYVLLAVGPGGKVSFGNAALQSCKWPQVLDDTGASVVLDFYKRVGESVEARDLRLLVMETDVLGRSNKKQADVPTSDGIEIDLSADSLLSQLGTRTNHHQRFRVLDYDPRRTEAFHTNGQHRYVINSAVLNSDVIISVPKLKTHEKVGITCNLKGYVGAVGHKDCLAHHRFGSAKSGGDEYPSNSTVRHWMSGYHDWLQTRDASLPLQGSFQILDKSLKRILKRTGGISAGSWSGNDTAWRMALDVARLLHYADSSGVLRTSIQRKHLSLIDGIVGGEGEGPLAPTPVDSRVLLFSHNVAIGDWIAARLMGFEPKSIPLVREAFADGKYSLGASDPTREKIFFNQRQVNESDVGPILSRQFLPARGWQNYFGWSQ